MPVPSEIILTLKMLKGIGNKTILKIVQQAKNEINNLDELICFWATLKGKTFEKVTKDDLVEAHQYATRIISNSADHGVGIFTYFDDCYPVILKQCTDENGKLDPPILLYYRGNLDALKMPGIAIIGTREPTENGVKAGLYFSEQFAIKGYNIVSGLAIGCDTTGHKGALQAGGITTAFLANGLDWDSIYPKENLELAKQIVASNGLLLSEYPVGQSCGTYGLVARDRLQVGLSLATIVIQTGIRGGTMHAVNATIASKKPLFAVEYRNPTDWNHEKVQGNIKLIKDRAAHSLQSTNFGSALEIISATKHNNTLCQSSEKTLFDL